ncbi:MAG: hypothetical protein J5656_06860 [Clostridia bacterium]|nr:hypothetical protein [Clostridia bacterium]
MKKYWIQIGKILVGIIIIILAITTLVVAVPAAVLICPIYLIMKGGNEYAKQRKEKESD